MGSNDEFWKFIAKYPAKSYKKGETILLEGDVPKKVLVIESGTVKTYTITGGGDEHLVSFDRRGEDIPMGVALGIAQRADYFYEAFTKCVVRFIPPEDYIEYLLSDPDHMFKQQVRLTRLLQATLARVNALEQRSALDKIAYSLLYMAEQLGVPMRPDPAYIKISITQQEIANSLGLARETANVELKKLESLGLIEHSRRSYILHMNRLHDYLAQH